MSLYINSDNQKLLWDVISKSVVFRELVPDKEEWFKSFIGRFYNEHCIGEIDKTALKELNRLTIQTMLDDLDLISKSTIPDIPIPIIASPVINIPGRDYKITETSTIETIPVNMDDYLNMYKLKPPPEINFRDTEIDGPISNMDELIKIHVAERDLELAKYSPHPPPPPSTTSSEKEINDIDLETKKVSWNDVIIEHNTDIPVMNLERSDSGNLA